MFTDKILAVVNDAGLRRAIWGRARILLPLTGARCATVQSMVYWAAKGSNVGTLKLGDLWPGTDGLDAYLRKGGWQAARNLDSLDPGMIAFTVDKSGRHPAPDHVYTFVGWESRPLALARIYDNYSASITLRNLGAGVNYKGKRYSRTPFAYALYPPV